MKGSCFRVSTFLRKGLAMPVSHSQCCSSWGVAHSVSHRDSGREVGLSIPLLLPHPAELGSPRPVETPTGVCLPSFLSGGKDRLSRLLHEGSWESPLLVLYFLHCAAVPRMVGGVEGRAGAARPVGGKPLGLLSAVAVVLFWGVERPRPGLGWWASPWSPGKVPASSQAVFSCLGLLRAG